jgi:hypothetical protein
MDVGGATFDLVKPISMPASSMSSTVHLVAARKSCNTCKKMYEMTDDVC